MDRSLTVEYVSEESLVLDPRHPRVIDPAELVRLRHSIRDHGFSVPILARAEDRTTIDGYFRLLAARHLGLEVVPVILLDLSTAEASALGIAVNRIHGGFDDVTLARLLVSLTSDFDNGLPELGIPPDEFDRLLRRLMVAEKRDRIETFDLDSALAEQTREPRAKRGDLWRLGDHQLLCGDATAPSDLARLLGGSHADMAITDPPYNVDLGASTPKSKARRRKIANDALAPEAWEAFVRASVANLLSSVDGAIYLFMSCREWPALCRILAELGGHWSDTIIWRKDRFTVGFSDYQRGYEPIWYGWREGAPHHWVGDRDQSDVWDIDRPATSPLHPTMKPIALLERAIENSTRIGGRVLDPFLGSGSTIIAAERTGRIGLGLELEPLYMDIAIRRWERFSGGVAVLEDGQS
jgi:DNA modification methylase